MGAENLALWSEKALGSLLKKIPSRVDVTRWERQVHRRSRMGGGFDTPTVMNTHIAVQSESRCHYTHSNDSNDKPRVRERPHDSGTMLEGIQTRWEPNG